MIYRENVESKEQAYTRGFHAGHNEALAELRSERRKETTSKIFLFLKKFGLVFGSAMAGVLFLYAVIAGVYYATAWVNEGFGIGASIVVGIATLLSLVIGSILYADERR